MAMTGLAKADYQCTSNSYDGQKLSIEENQITHYGNTVVVHTSEDSQKIFLGSLYHEGGVLLNKKVIKFFGSSGTLTVVSKPKFCGRGACDNNLDTKIEANLVLDEVETQFKCHETSH